MYKLRWLSEKIIKKLKLEKVLKFFLMNLLIIRKKEYIEGDENMLIQIHPRREVSCVVPRRELQNEYHLQIIVPMYNAEQYVEECLESLLSQKTVFTYKVILIDDGSKDNTVNVVKEYLSDERISLIRQENAGAAVARNTGLEEIRADYIMFLDIDDKLAVNAIENLLSKAYKEGAQIVEGSYDIFDKKIFAGGYHENASVTEACGVLWGFPWGKVISAELLCDIQFPEGYWYEDTIMSYLIHSRCRKTVTIRDVVYLYRKNASGFSHVRGDTPKLLDALWIYEIMFKDMRRLGIEVTQAIYEQFLESIIIGSKRIAYMRPDVRKCALSIYARMLKENFERFSSINPQMKCFEKVVRNNDYRAYKWLLLTL